MLQKFIRLYLTTKGNDIFVRETWARLIVYLDKGSSLLQDELRNSLSLRMANTLSQDLWKRV